MEQAGSVGDLLSALWRKKLVIVICGLLGLGLGIAAYAAWPARYEATSVYTVAPLSASPLGADSGSVNMDTEIVVATSAAVIDLAAKELQTSPTAVAAALQVNVPKGSDALEFTFAADDPEAAARGANAIADAYAANRTATAARVVDEAKKNLAATIAATQALALKAPRGSAERATLDIQISTLQQRLASLAAATLYPGTLVTEAQPPRKPSTPGRAILAASGAALGLLLGTFVAVLLSRRQGELSDQPDSSQAPVAESL
jgi:uncharacterized protein involved in exopolysaccharide biosynthesis